MTCLPPSFDGDHSAVATGNTWKKEKGKSCQQTGVCQTPQEIQGSKTETSSWGFLFGSTALGLSVSKHDSSSFATSFFN